MYRPAQQGLAKEGVVLPYFVFFAVLPPRSGQKQQQTTDLQLANSRFLFKIPPTLMT